MRLALRLAIIALAVVATPGMVEAAQLPVGMVYLSDIAPQVSQDMRYAGKNNFTHAPVPGYGAAECILAEPAAQALSAAADALQAQGLGLKVYDCYRPQKAVRHFVTWAADGEGFDKGHYPRIDRQSLIANGYIARRSGHSNGYAVDLTLIDRAGADIDMGTPFDYFDPNAHTASSRVSTTARRHRQLLVSAMEKAGFVNYSREWWHFSLRSKPRAASSFDFDIIPRGR